MNREQIDPKLDLYFERVIETPRELVWKAWTMPEHIVKWFTPAPWKTVEAEVDLRPGGMFRTVFQSPDGKDFPNIGCFLEVVPNEKLVWTNALKPGFRPADLQAEGAMEDFGMTAMLLLEPHGTGTKYRARVLHADEEGARKHAAMGFQEGWGKALDQLVEMAKTM